MQIKSYHKIALFWFVQNEPAQLSELGERVPKARIRY